MPPEKPRVLPIRTELAVLPAPPRPDGSPSWTIHDPISHRFFRIGWQEYEMMQRWSLQDAKAIAQAVARETTLTPEVDDVLAFSQFLIAANLVEVGGEMHVSLLKSQAKKPSWLHWLLVHYLFIRVPLVRPDRFLTKALPFVEPLMTRTFLWVVAASALLGGFLVLRQWDSFIHSFPYFFTPIGVAVMALTIAAGKTLHEMGHAFATKHFGCRVPTMGLALVVMWPVLYTDTTDAWKLTDRRARIAIDAAGMCAELALAAFATLAWSLLPEGTLRSGAFILSTTSWMLTLIVNLNPLLRFDGYYLLADLLDIPNLQERGFALARWWLRELLFGLDDPPPEVIPPRPRRIVLAYAYATWIYRFFLFIGIAYLVYKFTFKVLGIALFVVEIGFFIVRPIWRELKTWSTLRDRFDFNRHSAITASAAALLLLWLLVPWNTTTVATAVLRSAVQAPIQTALAGQIELLAARNGKKVKRGELLMRLASPDVDHDLDTAQRRLDLVRYEAENAGVAPQEDNSRLPINWNDVAAAEANQRAAAAEQTQLETRAPADGILVDTDFTLAPGEWLPANTTIGTLIDPGRAVVEAYVGEADIARIAVGAAGKFIPDDLRQPSVRVHVVSIGDTSIGILRVASVGSTAGGGVAVHQTKDSALVPESAVYKVILVPDSAVGPARVAIRGKLRLDSAPHSLIATIWRRVAGVVIRESGF